MNESIIYIYINNIKAIQNLNILNYFFVKFLD